MEDKLSRKRKGRFQEGENGHWVECCQVSQELDRKMTIRFGNINVIDDLDNSSGGLK